MGLQLQNVTTGVQKRPPRIVIHGGPGAGKTSLLADVPGIVIVPVEEGLGLLDVPHFDTPRKIEDVFDALTELVNEKHSYKAVGIDTVDKVEALVWDRVCADEGKENIEKIGYAKGYKFADRYWIQFYQLLDACRRRGMNVFVTAHSATKNVDDTLVGTYARTAPKLHDRAYALLEEWCEVMGYLYVERVRVEKGKDGSLQKTNTAQTTGQRYLGLEDTGSYVAKNRFGLPSRIEVPRDHPYSTLRSELAAKYRAATPPSTTEPEPKPADAAANEEAA